MKAVRKKTAHPVSSNQHPVTSMNIEHRTSNIEYWMENRFFKDTWK